MVFGVSNNAFGTECLIGTVLEGADHGTDLAMSEAANDGVLSRKLCFHIIIFYIIHSLLILNTIKVSLLAIIFLA